MFFIAMDVVRAAAANRNWNVIMWCRSLPAVSMYRATAGRCVFSAMTDYTVAEKIIASASMSSNFEALIDVV